MATRTTSLHPENRPHRPDKADRVLLHDLYSVLFATDKLTLRQKQLMFEIAAESKNSWRVVSISTAALEHLKSNKDKNQPPTSGLQRGHLLSRKKRAQRLFERKAPLTMRKLLAYFFEHDTVALVTKEENKKEGAEHWSKLHPVPEGFFTGGSFSVYTRKADIEWALRQSY